MFGFIFKHLRTYRILEPFVLQNPSRLSSLRCISSNKNANRRSFTVSYLINSCGLSPESALSASKRVKFRTTDGPDSVISLFKNHGFSQTQILNLVQRCPLILLYDPDKTILPKLELFYSKGFSSSEVAKIMSFRPRFLCRSLRNHLIPSFNYLKELLQSDGKTVSAIKRNYFIIDHAQETFLAPKFNFLLDVGVPQSSAVWLFHEYPSTFLTNLERFKKIVSEIEGMGFNPSKSHFVKAVALFSSLNRSLLGRKFDAYKRWNWSDEDIFAAFKKQPMCLATSENKIMAIMDLFVNVLGWESSFVAKHPTLLTCSLEKRLIPRVQVLQFLLSKGCLKNDFRPINFFYYPETKFLQKFVNAYVEAPILLKLYGEKLTQKDQ